MAPDYQRLGRGGDFTGMALKYQCAKALTIVSMAAIVILAFASMFYTGTHSRHFRHAGIVHGRILTSLSMQVTPIYNMLKMMMLRTQYQTTKVKSTNPLKETAMIMNCQQHKANVRYLHHWLYHSLKMVVILLPPLITLFWTFYLLCPKINMNSTAKDGMN